MPHEALLNAVALLGPKLSARRRADIWDLVERIERELTKVKGSGVAIKVSVITRTIGVIKDTIDGAIYDPERQMLIHVANAVEAQIKELVG